MATVLSFEQPSPSILRHTAKAHPEMRFLDAALAWLEVHRAYIGPRTVEDYAQYITSLNKFFGRYRLREIGITEVREYHKWRLLPPGVRRMEGRAGASLVRMESSTLRQIMQEAGCWEDIKPLYRHPPLSKREKQGSGQSFTREEEEAIVRVGLSIHRCDLAAHCAQIMFMTGLGFGELRRVRRNELDIQRRTIAVVEGAKNDMRERQVPLNDKALASAEWLLKRWQTLGGTKPDEYLLPFRSTGKQNHKPDFYRPMAAIDGGWRRILNTCHERGLLPPDKRPRIYDCRVTAVTKALGSGKVSLDAAEKLFGHVSRAMQRRYYKPEIDELREAAAALDATAEPEAVTAPEPQSGAIAKILEAAKTLGLSPEQTLRIIAEQQLRGGAQ